MVAKEIIGTGPFYAGWGRRRRWMIAVGLMVAFLCGGLGIAVPAVLLLDYTDRQGDPPTSPTQAADLYLAQLDQGEPIGLRRAFADGRRDELVEQWSRLKTTIERTDPAPDKLEWSTFDIEDQGDDKAVVTVPVQAVWWDGAMSMVGDEHPWRFSMRREDGGWRITEVEPFPWCGGHVQPSSC
ncbi:hypothetical protein AB0C29_10680 [Actinoplanes sp. NPDC048791]|uniref:hypothetical protein n=1 Tax=Actinoplanes sp. NPDC048791 TaxID=3154623 RepID=UPI0033CEBD20